MTAPGLSPKLKEYTGHTQMRLHNEFWFTFASSPLVHFIFLLLLKGVIRVHVIVHHWSLTPSADLVCLLIIMCSTSVPHCNRAQLSTGDHQNIKRELVTDICVFTVWVCVCPCAQFQEKRNQDILCDTANLRSANSSHCCGEPYFLFIC